MLLIGFFSILLIWFVGFTVIRLISSEKRLEIIIPISLFTGISLFIFLLNILSYIIHPPLGVYISYLLFILFGLFLLTPYKKFRIPLDIPKKRSLFLIFLSLIIWSILISKIIGHMNLTGDPFIYQTVAQSYIKGNFPIFEPWQPDIKFSYHYGPSIFLGVFHKIFNLPYDFIQRISSFLAVLMLSQFLIWFLKRHTTFKSLIVYQLIPLISLVTLGNWMIALPILPFSFPSVTNGLISWLSQLPTAHVSFSTYGGSTNDLNGLVYFYHELIGMISFIWITWLSFTYNKKLRELSFLFITIGIAATAIINEVFFPLSILTSTLIILLREYPFEKFFTLKRIFLAASLCLLLTILTAFQGGTLTELIFGGKSEHPTVILFPDKKNIFVFIDKDISLQNYEKSAINWEDYQKTQQSSKLFSQQEKWYPFRWFHPGFIYFYFANILIGLIYYFSKQRDKLPLFFTLLIPAIVLTLLYNATYVIANNSSRLIAFTYTFLGTNIIIFIVLLLEYLARRRKNLFLILTLFIVAWLSIPSFLPPLIQQLRPAEIKNRLFHQEPEIFPPVINWVSKNLPYNARVFNLVPRGYNSLTLAKVGIFTPTWPPKVRAYTMDGSPQYFDASYTLNPLPLAELKATHLIIDSVGFSKLPPLRQKQVTSLDYFEPLFISSESNWEGVYLIKNKYYMEAENLPNTFNELDRNIIPLEAKVYIDVVTPSTNKDLAAWFSLRRALIFTLRDRELYYKDGLPSGNNLPYQHVEARVSGNQPSKYISYDYLALFNGTSIDSVCNCQAQVIWKGFEDNIVIWRVLK